MKESNESLIETAKSMTLALIKVGGNISLTRKQLSHIGLTIDDIEISKVIEDEIKLKMSESDCHCGEIELVEDTEFVQSYGRFCAECGTQLIEGAQWCPECGNRVD